MRLSQSAVQSRGGPSPYPFPAREGDVKRRGCAPSLPMGEPPPKRLLWQRSCRRRRLRIVPTDAANPFGSTIPWRPIPYPFPVREGGCVVKGLRPFTANESAQTKRLLRQKGGAECAQWAMQRGGSPVSKGALGSRPCGDTARPLRTVGPVMAQAVTEDCPHRCG